MDLVTSSFLCDNPACCPTPSCTLGHKVGHVPGSATQLRVCKYGTACSDALCCFYHPNHKYKGLCSHWADCVNFYCRYSHAHKLRRPICRQGGSCDKSNCRRIHPPTNAALEGTPLWSVFTGLSYLIEAFTDFADCRQLSLTCHSLNAHFSTHKARLARSYSMANKYLSLPAIDHYGIFDVWVPSQDVRLYATNDFSLVRASTVCNYFSYLLDGVDITSLGALQKRFVSAPPAGEWLLVSNDDERLVLEYPRGVNLCWQTKEKLSSLQEVDVCYTTGVWYTCTVCRVSDDSITVDFPWWFSCNQVSPLRTYTTTYPSALIAPARSQGFDWRSRIRVGSRLLYRIGGLTLTVRILAEDLGFYIAKSKYLKFEFPTSLEDTPQHQFAPLPASYTLSPAEFSIPKLDLSDPTTRTRITFHARTRYDLPEVLVL